MGIKEIEGADYNIKVAPLDNRTWRETQDLEVVFTLKTKTESKTFRGTATLFGIIKKQKEMN
jgi:hypothetical protein